MYVSIGAPSVVDKNTGVIIRGEGQLVDTDLVVPLTKVNTLDIGVSIKTFTRLLHVPSIAGWSPFISSACLLRNTGLFIINKC